MPIISIDNRVRDVSLADRHSRWRFEEYSVTLPDSCRGCAYADLAHPTNVQSDLSPVTKRANQQR